MSAAFVKLKKDEIFMQKAKPGRGQRVAEQIARDLAEIIPLEVRDPRVGLVTITGCEITPDYAHARVFFTVVYGFTAASRLRRADRAGSCRRRAKKPSQGGRAKA